MKKIHAELIRVGYISYPPAYTVDLTFVEINEMYGRPKIFPTLGLTTKTDKQIYTKLQKESIKGTLFDLYTCVYLISDTVLFLIIIVPF